MNRLTSACRCGIDVHTHVVPEKFPSYIGSLADVPWPSMEHDGCGHAHMFVLGKRYRTLDSDSWDTSRRLRDLDTMNLERQVLSPMPELLSYWLPLEAAKQLLRFMNDSIAEMVSREPARLFGLGAVPLQDTDAAIEELHYVMKTLRLQGVEIATHVNGKSIGEKSFDPFFAEAAKLGAAVFVHGLRPSGTDRLVGPDALAQVVAFPGDVALAAASLVTGGMLERHPELRICLSHGGGSFPTVIPRLRNGWKTIPPVRDSMSVDPAETAKRFYCDSLTYDIETLRLAIRAFGEDKVMIGTDYPYPVLDKTPTETIAALGLSAEVERAMLEGNALRFLGVTSNQELTTE